MSTPTREPYRPVYHFTPPANWLNDPNGMVYFQGEYHLFYQYHPGSTLWGPMHWGHAVTTDLVHWRHLPVALYPDELGAIFSGSAVIDWHNTAGFGPETMVAIYTHDIPNAQDQCLATSHDAGRTWEKYAYNPVVLNTIPLRDFRDPKVFWYASNPDVDPAAGHWVLLLVAGDVVLFYTSPDLKQWTQSGSFGAGAGAKGGVWETPELLHLAVDGGAERRWLLVVAVGDGAIAGGSGVQYFVGDFDGHVFTSDNPNDTVLWADYGADFYAPQAWNDPPDDRRIWLAWMSNWAYARETPTTAFRGAMTIPREVALTRTPAGIRLVQRPVVELAMLRSASWRLAPGNIAPPAPGEPSPEQTDRRYPEALECKVTFQCAAAITAQRCGIRFCYAEGVYLEAGIDLARGALFVDRTQVWEVPEHPTLAVVQTAPLASAGDMHHLHIFLDRSSVEVFAGGGQVVITDQIFPRSDDRAPDVTVQLFADGEGVRLVEGVIYALEPAAG
ncbi:MAG: glycoside hydrolase family 32 protein [Anaerolineales bacterium]|nr:glycoside hydrolase family 32 protein [Anaerolineales bacterium]